MTRAGVGMALVLVAGCQSMGEPNPQDAIRGYAIGMAARGFDETRFVEAPMAPPRWHTAPSSFPAGTLLGSYDVEADDREQPPAHVLVLKVERFGLPPGTQLPFDGGENPDPESFDFDPMPRDPIWVLPVQPFDVHDIPPGLLFAISADFDYDHSKLTGCCATPPPYWKQVAHTPVPGQCEIPPNPVYGVRTPSTDARPEYWCIRKAAMGGIPKGAMFGSMDGNLLPWQQSMYEVKRYDAVSPCRWLFRYR